MDVDIVTQRVTRFGRIDWGAVLAGVVTALGVTYMLVALGRATGISADDGIALADVTVIAVGTWTVISSVIGMLVGGFVGGRFSRWLSDGAAVYHGLTAWAAMIVLTAWLGTAGAAGLLGTGVMNIVTAADENAAIIAWDGWAVVIGMIVTLLAAIGGWWAGSRMSLAAFEESDLVTDRKTVSTDEPEGGIRSY